MSHRVSSSPGARIAETGTGPRGRSSRVGRRHSRMSRSCDATSCARRSPVRRGASLFPSVAPVYRPKKSVGAPVGARAAVRACRSRDIWSSTNALVG